MSVVESPYVNESTVLNTYIPIPNGSPANTHSHSPSFAHRVILLPSNEDEHHA